MAGSGSEMIDSESCQKFRIQPDPDHNNGTVMHEIWIYRYFEFHMR